MEEKKLDLDPEFYDIARHEKSVQSRNVSAKPDVDASWVVPGARAKAVGSTGYEVVIDDVVNNRVYFTYDNGKSSDVPLTGAMGFTTRFIPVEEQMGESVYFDKFMDRIISEEHTKRMPVMNDSPLRANAARYQERPMGRTRMGIIKS